MAQKEFNPSFEGRLKENRVLRVVFDVNMQNGHDGLREVARKLNQNLDSLEVGEFVVFMNTKRTILKIFASGNTIAHFKHPLGHKIDLRLLSMIPRFFNGRELNYPKAIEEILKKEL